LPGGLDAAAGPDFLSLATSTASDPLSRI